MDYKNNHHANRAILVDVISPETSKEEAAKSLQELESLVNTYGGVVVVKTIQKKSLPDYETYIGKGKLDEIFEIGKEKEADIVVINNILKPRQIFNINENLRKAKLMAWDRVDLILKIFARHAQSTEAKLQIELASIRHMGPRIFDMGLELSRQGGAVGLRSGQGESNTEVMKRHLQRQELNLVKKLEHYHIIRKGHRERRKRQNYKTAALVGYTNAGKSALLNALTNKGTYVADKLFATLDTRVGKLFIPSNTSHEDGKYSAGQEWLLSDTIGFIQNLPPTLIQAFKSTLAETVEADLLLHVIDVTDPQMEMKIRVVEEILAQLDLKDRQKIYVFNKIDLIDYSKAPDVTPPEEFDESKRPNLIQSGKDTAKLLGWHYKEEEEERKKNLVAPPSPLDAVKKEYKEFNPIFVSAHKKINLDNLLSFIANR